MSSKKKRNMSLKQDANLLSGKAINVIVESSSIESIFVDLNGHKAIRPYFPFHFWSTLILFFNSTFIISPKISLPKKFEVINRMSGSNIYRDF
jgi:hypothetical protein